MYQDQLLTNQAQAFSSSLSWSEIPNMAIGVNWRKSTGAALESDMQCTHALWSYSGMIADEPFWQTAAGLAPIYDLVSPTTDISNVVRCQPFSPNDRPSCTIALTYCRALSCSGPHTKLRVFLGVWCTVPRTQTCLLCPQNPKKVLCFLLCGSRCKMCLLLWRG